MALLSFEIGGPMAGRRRRPVSNRMTQGSRDLTGRQHLLNLLTPSQRAFDSTRFNPLPQNRASSYVKTN